MAPIGSLLLHTPASSEHGARAWPPLLRHRGLFAAGLALSLLGLGATEAADQRPQVVEVPFRPAFVRAPGGGEKPALARQILAPQSLLRTEKPGRMQVRLADGRQFRLGGDAVLRLEIGRAHV